MKRILFLLFVAVAFVSCEGPTGPMGPQGEPGYDGLDGKDGLNGKDGEGLTDWHVVTYTVKASEWVLEGDNSNVKEDDLGSYYSYLADNFPELTEDVVKDGAIVVYYYNPNANTWHPLPYTVPMYEKDENGNVSLYTVAFSFDYAVGSVKFYFDVSDFYTGSNFPNEDMTFKVVIFKG